MFDKAFEKAIRRLDSTELFSVDSEKTEVTFESGVLKSIEHKNTSGLALRTIHGGRLGFSSTTDPVRIDDMIEQARTTAAFGKEADFSFPSRAAAAQTVIFDPAIVSFDASAMVEDGHRAISLLRETCPKGLTNVSFEKTVSNIRIANSNGLDASYYQTTLSHSIVLNVIENDSIIWIEDGGEYCSLERNTDIFSASIADLYRKAERKATRRSGMLPVIVTGRQMPSLLHAVELGVNGMSLVKGDSPLIGREGDRVLGNATIYDDPLLEYAPSSRPFDDEGIQSRQTPLFENGVFRNYLFSLNSAASAGRETTGNGTRRGLSSPDTAASNLVMSPGASTWNEMIRVFDECIVVNGLIGGGQSNLLAGDFSVNVILGFLVVHGEYAGRVVDTMISGNIYSAFDHIGAAGSVLHRAGSVNAPDVLFGELSVSGA